MIASSDQTSAAIPACPAPREAKPPRCAPPRRACDTHAHVFGPAARFPYAADRSYTPPDAPLAKYLGMLDTVGFARGVLVQGSAHGGDNAAMLDALAREPKRLRGIAVAGAGTQPAELRRWHEFGVRGLRFNHFFRGGALHYRGGVPLDAAKVLAPVMAELGWHLQLWIDVKDLPDTIPILKALGLPVVIDHMGRTDASAGTQTTRLSKPAAARRRRRMLGQAVGRSPAEHAGTGLSGCPPVSRGTGVRQSGALDLGERLAASPHGRRHAGGRGAVRFVLHMDPGRSDPPADSCHQPRASLWLSGVMAARRPSRIRRRAANRL